MGIAETRARDERWLQQAWAHDVAGEAALVQALPERVAQLRQMVGPRRTRWLWQDGLRALARAERVEPALAAFARADDRYWSVVLAWRAWILRRAEHDEQHVGVAKGELGGLYFEIAYAVAVRMDPALAGFGTYFNHWRRSLMPRATEVRTLVAGSKALGVRARTVIVSVDKPRYANEDEDARSLLDEMGGTDPAFDALEGADLFATVRPRLSPRMVAYLDLLREEDNMAVIARKQGVSREAVRQNVNRLVAEIRALAPGVAAV